MPDVMVNGKTVDVVRHGSGRDLLLLHSLLADRTSFHWVVPELSKRYRVTLPNLPGYGATPALAPPVAIEDYADWVAKLMRALQLPASTTVLGNGFGGFIATALAVRHGAHFDQLIVADALPGFPPAGKAPLRGLAARVAQEGMVGALDVAIRRMFPEDFITAHPEIIDERKQALASADPVAFQHACHALADLDLQPVLGTIRNTTLVLVGADDQTTPPAIARQLAASIAGARYAEIAGCGHCPQIQKPQELIALIDGFLA